MEGKLFLKAVSKFALGVICVALLLFIPAGSFGYWNGWLLMALLFAPMFAAGLILLQRNPELLEKRLNAKEKEPEQKKVIVLSAVMFILAFIAAGLNYRFRWFWLPVWAALIGAAVFIAAYLMYAEVLRENVYLSRTIEVQKGQKVIDSGLYSIVRHPMYCATLFLFVSMGFVLGSPVSVVILLFYVPIIVKRIRNEEKVLEKGLEGYADYMKKVKYRLIPYIW